VALLAVARNSPLPFPVDTDQQPLSMHAAALSWRRAICIAAIIPARARPERFPLIAPLAAHNATLLAAAAAAPFVRDTPGGVNRMRAREKVRERKGAAGSERGKLKSCASRFSRENLICQIYASQNEIRAWEMLKSTWKFGFHTLQFALKLLYC
jgi:hypothetical protein